MKTEAIENYLTLLSDPNIKLTDQSEICQTIAKENTKSRAIFREIKKKLEQQGSPYNVYAGFVSASDKIGLGRFGEIFTNFRLLFNNYYSKRVAKYVTFFEKNLKEIKEGKGDILNEWASKMCDLEREHDQMFEDFLTKTFENKTEEQSLKTNLKEVEDCVRSLKKISKESSLQQAKEQYQSFNSKFPKMLFLSRLLLSQNQKLIDCGNDLQKLTEFEEQTRNTVGGSRKIEDSNRKPFVKLINDIVKNNQINFYQTHFTFLNNSLTTDSQKLLYAVWSEYNNLGKGYSPRQAFDALVKVRNLFPEQTRDAGRLFLEFGIESNHPSMISLSEQLNKQSRSNKEQTVETKNETAEDFETSLREFEQITNEYIRNQILSTKNEPWEQFPLALANTLLPKSAVLELEEKLNKLEFNYGDFIRKLDHKYDELLYDARQKLEATDALITLIEETMSSKTFYNKLIRLLTNYRNSFSRDLQCFDKLQELFDMLLAIDAKYKADKPKALGEKLSALQQMMDDKSKPFLLRLKASELRSILSERLNTEQATHALQKTISTLPPAKKIEYLENLNKLNLPADLKFEIEKQRELLSAATQESTAEPLGNFCRELLASCIEDPREIEKTDDFFKNANIIDAALNKTLTVHGENAFINVCEDLLNDDDTDIIEKNKIIKKLAENKTPYSYAVFEINKLITAQASAAAQKLGESNKTGSINPTNIEKVRAVSSAKIEVLSELKKQFDDKEMVVFSKIIDEKIKSENRFVQKEETYREVQMAKTLIAIEAKLDQLIETGFESESTTRTIKTVKEAPLFKTAFDAVVFSPLAIRKKYLLLGILEKMVPLKWQEEIDKDLAMIKMQKQRYEQLLKTQSREEPETRYIKNKSMIVNQIIANAQKADVKLPDENRSDLEETAIKGNATGQLSTALQDVNKDSYLDVRAAIVKILSDFCKDDKLTNISSLLTKRMDAFEILSKQCPQTIRTTLSKELWSDLGHEEKVIKALHKISQKENVRINLTKIEKDFISPLALYSPRKPESLRALQIVDTYGDRLYDPIQDALQEGLEISTPFLKTLAINNHRPLAERISRSVVQRKSANSKSPISNAGATGGMASGNASLTADANIDIKSLLTEIGGKLNATMTLGEDPITILEMQRKIIIDYTRNALYKEFVPVIKNTLLKRTEYAQAVFDTFHKFYKITDTADHYYQKYKKEVVLFYSELKNANPDADYFYKRYRPLFTDILKKVLDKISAEKQKK